MKNYQYKTTPRIHQIEALEKGWDKPYFAYLMDRGTGKTKVALDNAALLYQKEAIEALLVIAPNEVHERWVTEQIPIHLPNIPIQIRVWINSNSKKYIKSLEELFEFKEDFPLRIMTMNIEAFQTKKGQNFAKNFARKYRTMTVVDESTKIKTPGAKRTKSIITLGKYSKYRRILTGNEVTNSPFDVYAQFKFLDFEFWDMNFFVFQHHYAKFLNRFATIKKCKNFTPCSECKQSMQPRVVRFFDRSKDDWNVQFKCTICDKKITSANPKVTAEAAAIKRKRGLYEFPVLQEYQNMDELRAKMKPYVFRVRKKDCLDLPEKIYDPIYAELNSNQTRIYKELKENLYAEFEDQELTVVNKISLMVRFQQIVGGFFPSETAAMPLGNPKMDRLLYDLEDIDDDAIIIWAIFRPEIKFIAKILRKTYPDKIVETYFGDTKKLERKIIIDKFQKGNIHFLVANPECAGTGLNLQRSNLHYYFSNSFKAESRWQSEDRSHRDGQHWPVVYKDIVIKDTIDDTIQKAIKQKQNIAEFFKDHTILELV